MPTIDMYNATRKRFANGEVNVWDLKVMLVDSGYVFSPAHSNVSVSVKPHEVSGNGWDEGGEPLENPSISVTDTDEAALDADDISKTASGGSIGPATGAVIWGDDTADAPLFYIDFEGEEEAGEGTPFVITWNASGIMRWLSGTG